MLFRGETACIQCGISTWESQLQSLPDPLCSASGNAPLLTWQRRHSVSVCPLKPGCFCLNTSSDGELIVCPVLMLLVESESVRWSVCPIMDCSPPSSYVRGILQARILEWVAIPFSRRSSQPRDWIRVSCIAGRFFTVWATCWVSFKEGFSSFAAHDNSLGSLFNMEVPWTHPEEILI